MLRHRAVVISTGAIVILVSVLWLVSSRQTEALDSFADCSQQGYPVTDTNPPVCSDGENTILGPLHAPESPPAPLTSQPFELLVDGDSGGKYAQSQQLISNPEAWQAYWRSVHAALPALPPILPVDFGASNVIALSEGPKPTGGYLLKITNITSSPIGTIVDYTETTPSSLCPGETRPTNRYFIVRTGVLPQPVSFRGTKVARTCGPQITPGPSSSPAR
jgi:hypothetical protein